MIRALQPREAARKEVGPKNRAVQKLLASAKRKPSKYRAVRTTVDGITFDSKREAARFVELKMLQKAGVIGSLCFQPGWSLHVYQKAGVDESDGLGMYFADFGYIDLKTGKHVYEDVKGYDTPLSRWKRKHLKAQSGIDVRIVK